MTASAEEELREAMESAVDGLTPPSDLVARVKRQHRWRTGGMGLAVAAAVAMIVLATNLLVGGTWPARSPAPVGAAGKSNGTSPEPPGGLALPGPNALAWPYRGGLYVEGPSDIDRRAVAKWAQVQGKEPAETVASPLFGTELPSGQKVLIFQITELAGGPAHTSVYVEPANSSSGAIVRDDVLSADVSQISQVVSGGDTSYLIVLSSPSDTSITYAPDGSRAATPLKLRDTQGRGGWAVFAQRGPVPPAATVTIKRCPRCPVVYQGRITR